MKSKEYVNNFFNEGKLVDQNGLLLTLNAEFIIYIESIPAFINGERTQKMFNNAVTNIRSKFVAISNKVQYGLPEKLWRYFYANYLMVYRDYRFPEVSDKVFRANKALEIKRNNPGPPMSNKAINKIIDEEKKKYDDNLINRIDKLSRSNKYIIDLFDKFNLKITCSMEDLVLKYNQKNDESLKEYFTICRTYILFRNEKNRLLKE